jgi:adenylate cyclase
MTTGRPWRLRFPTALLGRRSLAAALCLAMLVLRLFDPQPLRDLREKSFDGFQHWAPRVAAEHPAVIVDIDEPSLARYGQWPWPRELLADLIEKLTAAGAAAIALDMVFPEADRMSPANFALVARGLDPDLRARLTAMPDADARFAQAIASGRVVVGVAALPQANGPPRAPAFGVAALGNPRGFLPEFPGLLTNVPAIEAAAAGHGLLSVLPESDGVVRRLPLAAFAQGALIASLSLETLRVATGADTLLIKSDAAGVQSLSLPQATIPVDERGRLWIYFSAHDPARFVSAADVLDDRAPPERFAGKIIMIGASAIGLKDVKSTPLDPAEAGVEIHVQALENILSGQVLSEPSYALPLELLLTVLLCLALVAVAPGASATGVLALGLAVAAVLILCAALAFRQALVLIDASFPLLTCAMVYSALVFANYIDEQRQRRRIRSAFARYLAPELVEQLSQAPERLRLGGEERLITLMFADVRGFTAIAEGFRHDPKGLTALMNRLLSPLSEAILSRRGAIDKYMGDAIMAFWNAPLDDPDHRSNACAAALDMQARLDELNRARDAEAGGGTHVPLKIGIGVNSGLCVVGNFGSDHRFDYSALGDPVNLASRLEGQSKVYGVDILVGGETARGLEARFALLEIDRIRMQGKDEPETVFVLLGDDTLAATPAFRALSEAVATLLGSYRTRDWAGARAALAAAHATGGDRIGGVLDLYARRLEACERAPPPADWDGVFAAVSK